MHPTAISNCKSFFDAYANAFASEQKEKSLK
jgi:hypothetical protein